MLDDWVAQHDFRNVADAPSDIEQEMLPAGRGAAPCGRGAGRSIRSTTSTSAPVDAPFAEGGHFIKVRAAPPRPVHPADRRDGLRCGVPGDGHARVRPARQPGAHPSADQHRTRRHEPAIESAAPAKSSGLATRSVKSSSSHLDQMPLPAIVHWDEYHWIVLSSGRARARQGRRPRCGPPAIDARRVRAEVDRLCRALRLHA